MTTFTARGNQQEGNTGASALGRDDMKPMNEQERQSHDAASHLRQERLWRFYRQQERFLQEKVVFWQQQHWLRRQGEAFEQERISSEMESMQFWYESATARRCDDEGNGAWSNALQQGIQLNRDFLYALREQRRYFAGLRQAFQECLATLREMRNALQEPGEDRYQEEYYEQLLTDYQEIQAELLACHQLLRQQKAAYAEQRRNA